MKDTERARLTPWGVLKEVFNWYPKEYPAQERKLLFKLDLSILIFACLCFFTKFLDQSNISNAFVSGMKEELKLYGNELNWFNTYYYIAYVIFQVPFMILISRPKVSRWLLPSLEVIWGVLTFAQSRVTNVKQLYALRFLVGMAETPVFAGTHFILGSWYSGPELFKRAGTWFICNSLGSMFSGYLQAAAYKNLSGVSGMAGWRWLFIIDGIITIPIAIVGFVVFPGVPDSPKAWYFKDKEIALAKQRMVKAKVKRAGRLSLDVFKRTLSRWHFYVFVFCYICMIIASYPGSYMNLWLKAEHYSVSRVNTYPTGINAVTALASWLGTTLASIYPSWAIYSISMGSAIFSCICMTIWRIPTGLKFFAWYLLGLTGCASPILYSTVNTIIKNDAEERALVIGSMMSIGYSFNIWVPIFAFPTAGKYGAPRWPRGWPVSITFWFSLWIAFIAAIILHRREREKNGLEGAGSDVFISDHSSRKSENEGSPKSEPIVTFGGTPSPK